MPKCGKESFRAYNTPKRTPNARRKSAVCAKKGSKVKLVRFGDPSMPIRKDEPVRKKSYCARSSGIKGSWNIFSANFWSRDAWGC